MPRELVTIAYRRCYGAAVSGQVFRSPGRYSDGTGTRLVFSVSIDRRETENPKRVPFFFTARSSSTICARSMLPSLMDIARLAPYLILGLFVAVEAPLSLRRR